MVNIKNNKFFIEGFVAILIGVILFLMSFYYLKENIYIESRDLIGEGRIIDSEEEGFFKKVPILIYKNQNSEYVFSKGDIIGGFNISDTHEIIYRRDNQSRVIIKDDYMSRFFNCITLFIVGIIFNFLGFILLKKGKINSF